MSLTSNKVFLRNNNKSNKIWINNNKTLMYKIYRSTLKHTKKYNNNQKINLLMIIFNKEIKIVLRKKITSLKKK
jgi:hypothetical protein